MRQRLGGLQFKTCHGKKLVRPISMNKLSMVVHSCDPSYSGGMDRRIAV
jgi:hypothetical protein